MSRFFSCTWVSRISPCTYDIPYYRLQQYIPQKKVILDVLKKKWYKEAEWTSRPDNMWRIGQIVFYQSQVWWWSFWSYRKRHIVAKIPIDWEQPPDCLFHWSWFWLHLNFIFNCTILSWVQSNSIINPIVMMEGIEKLSYLWATGDHIVVHVKNSGYLQP